MKQIHLPNEIISDKIVLKKHDLALAQTMFDYVDQDRERLAQFLPWVQFTNSVKDEIDYIELMQQKWDRHEFYDYGIFSKVTGLYMGNAGIHTISWADEHCEIGYWILGSFEGQGFMSEAAAALANVCFEVGFNRIEIRCDPKNLRSAQVPLRLGFRMEARLVQNTIDQNKNFRDTLIFARLKSEGFVEVLRHPSKMRRPDFIKHFSEILSPDNSRYPGSDELLAFGAPLGKETGLKKMGIHHEILKPGRRTSWPHAESAEEEFVYVVSGYPSAWINGELFQLWPGDAVGFAAGTGIAHTFINNSLGDAVLLVVGERNREENKCIYPLHPKRNEEIADSFWQDWPAQTMGLHDGLPNSKK